MKIKRTYYDNGKLLHEDTLSGNQIEGLAECMPYEVDALLSDTNCSGTRTKGNVREGGHWYVFLEKQ